MTFQHKISDRDFAPEHMLDVEIYPSNILSRELNRISSRAFSVETLSEVFQYVKERAVFQNNSWRVTCNKHLTLVQLDEYAFETGGLTLLRLQQDSLFRGLVKNPGMTRMVFGLDQQRNTVVLLLAYEKNQSNSHIPDRELQEIINAYHISDFDNSADIVELTHSHILENIHNLLKNQPLSSLELLYQNLVQQSIQNIIQSISFSKEYTEEDFLTLLEEIEDLIADLDQAIG